MPFIVLAQKLAFQKTDPANPTMPIGPEDIVERGGRVPAYATAFTLSALANSGMVVWADIPSPDVLPDSATPAQVRTPDQPPVLPSDPNGVPLPSGIVPEGPPPATADKKEVWEAYAQRPEIGMTQGEAEAMNKQDLMAEVRARYDATHQ